MQCALDVMLWVTSTLFAILLTISFGMTNLSVISKLVKAVTFKIKPHLSSAFVLFTLSTPGTTLSVKECDKIDRQETSYLQGLLPTFVSLEVALEMI